MATVNEQEAQQIDQANATGLTPVVFSWRTNCSR